MIRVSVRLIRIVGTAGPGPNIADSDGHAVTGGDYQSAVTVTRRRSSFTGKSRSRSVSVAFMLIVMERGRDVPRRTQLGL